MRPRLRKDPQQQPPIRHHGRGAHGSMGGGFNGQHRSHDALHGISPIHISACSIMAPETRSNSSKSSSRTSSSQETGRTGSRKATNTTKGSKQTGNDHYTEIRSLPTEFRSSSTNQRRTNALPSISKRSLNSSGAAYTTGTTNTNSFGPAPLPKHSVHSMSASMSNELNGTMMINNAFLSSHAEEEQHHSQTTTRVEAATFSEVQEGMRAFVCTCVIVML